MTKQWLTRATTFLTACISYLAWLLFELIISKIYTFLFFLKSSSKWHRLLRIIITLSSGDFDDLFSLQKLIFRFNFQMLSLHMLSRRRDRYRHSISLIGVMVRLKSGRREINSFTVITLLNHTPAVMEMGGSWSGCVGILGHRLETMDLNCFVASRRLMRPIFILFIRCILMLIFAGRVLKLNNRLWEIDLLRILLGNLRLH